MNSSLMLRRFCCFNTATSSSLSSCSKKKPLVFLGSPQVLFLSLSFVCCLSLVFGCLMKWVLLQVSTTVLDALFNASTVPDSLFEVFHHNSITLSSIHLCSFTFLSLHHLECFCFLNKNYYFNFMVKVHFCEKNFFKLNV